MLFRPEEVHVRSPVSPARALNPDGGDRVTHDICGLGRQQLFVAHHDDHRLAAVQTGGVHPYCLTRKKPANRQRFKSSLGEPFLFTVDGNPILVRQIVKGSDRNDLVGFRMQKKRIPGSFEVVKELSPFIHRDLQPNGQFGIMRRPTGLNKLRMIV